MIITYTPFDGFIDGLLDGGHVKGWIEPGKKNRRGQRESGSSWLVNRTNGHSMCRRIWRICSQLRFIYPDSILGDFVFFHTHVSHRRLRFDSSSGFFSTCADIVVGVILCDAICRVADCQIVITARRRWRSIFSCSTGQTFIHTQREGVTPLALYTLYCSWLIVAGGNVCRHQHQMYTEVDYLYCKGSPTITHRY